MYFLAAARMAKETTKRESEIVMGSSLIPQGR